MSKPKRIDADRLIRQYYEAVFFPFALATLIGAFGIMPWLVKSLCTTSSPGFRLRTHA